MKITDPSERVLLELAFDSSYAIVKLAGLRGNKELSELRERIISGELGFDEAVLTILSQFQTMHHKTSR